MSAPMTTEAEDLARALHETAVFKQRLSWADMRQDFKNDLIFQADRLIALGYRKVPADSVIVPRVATEERITELRGYAKDEGIVVNAASEQGVREYLALKPHIFLGDDGLFGAVWQDGRGRITVDFEADGTREAMATNRAASSPKQGGEK